MKTEYWADIYVRVSREDGDKPESDSISNQKKLCLDYLKSHPELRLHKIYEDDGYSGVSFERPYFLQMMEDIENKKANCIIVKDLSRFGRNWLKAGDYIQNIFPTKGVRFISINDNFDSLKSDRETTGLIMPIRNLINDTYAGDISQKTRTSFEVKRKMGEFVGAFAPYGYLKDKDDKHKLVVDEAAANVVRNIFNWKVQGLSLTRIADRLNEFGVLSPMEHKRDFCEKYTTSFKKNIRTKWTPVAVSRILSNEIYLGHLIQGKRGTANYKDKVVRYKAENQWVRTENTHEPIISRECFAMVQKLRNFDTRVSPKEEKLYIFSGILFCGDCKQNMVRRTVTKKDKHYYYYMCSTYKKNKENPDKHRDECSTHNISEKKLQNVVLTVLKKQIEQIVELEDVLKFIDEIPAQSERQKRINAEILKRQEDIHTIEVKKKGLYDDLYDGLITKDDFRNFYENYSNDASELKSAIKKYEEELEALKNNSQYDWVNRFKQYQNVDELNREMIITLLDKIYVYEDCRIEIKYNYSDEYEAALEYISAFEANEEQAVI